MAEASSTAFEQVFQAVVFLSHHSFSFFLHLPLSHTQAKTRFISLFSYRTETQLVSGIYQGWNSDRESSFEFEPIHEIPYEKI